MEAKRINSTKRNAILNLLMNSKEHPSAEMIYDGIRSEYPKMSYGTVYRNLSVLLEEGDVIKVGNVEGRDRYDARTDSHPHFVCRKCARVLDLDIMPVEPKVVSEIEKKYGYTADNYSLEFFGICDKCNS